MRNRRLRILASKTRQLFYPAVLTSWRIVDRVHSLPECRHCAPWKIASRCEFSARSPLAQIWANGKTQDISRFTASIGKYCPCRQRAIGPPLVLSFLRGLGVVSFCLIRPCVRARTHRATGPGCHPTPVTISVLTLHLRSLPSSPRTALDFHRYIFGTFRRGRKFTPKVRKMRKVRSAIALRTLLPFWVLT